MTVISKKLPGEASMGQLGRVRQVAKAGKLLLFNLVPKLAAKSCISRCSTSRGIQYDLYEPPYPPLVTYILVYGFDLAGEKDARLVRFGRACSASGLRLAAPSLDGLKSYRLDEADLEALSDLLSHLHARYSCRVGMIGFSAGGSLALLAAADPRVSDWVDPLFLFSPFYSLADLYAVQTAQPPLLPSSQRDWDHLVWSQLVLAYRNIGSLDLSASEQEELLDLLYKYCAVGLERKIDFFHRVLENRHIPGLREMKVESQALDRFSPCAKLGGVKGRVFIFHDPNDYLVPVAHSQKIMQELSQRDRHEPISSHEVGKPVERANTQADVKQRLLITPLISHVTPRYALRVKESIKAMMMLSELFVR